ncbi:competence protein CoiA [Cytobacillus gottheilii]|uniref:competence protein CoiA n=1 Tax=Cytobacillus gottheilii TaxID=859144 RepID=UPI0015930972|nr:competence protein CoiA family protein [Cytobacillus gottheilii]
MLTAVNGLGEVISLFRSYSRSEINSLKEKGPYYCRECAKPVIVKAGEKRIPHFAHQMHSRCPESYENESQYHLNGKVQLYNWLKQEGISSVLECYYPDIQQRADIGFRLQKQLYAIEFQCSAIADDLFYKRTQSYLKAGIIPIWILGANKFKRLDYNRISLTQFNYLFLTQHQKKSWMILSFCPNTKHFIFIKNPLPYSAKNAFAQMLIKPLKNTCTSDILQIPDESAPLSFQKWLAMIRKQKNFAAVSHSSFSRELLYELYNQGISPTSLPSEIGLPVFHSPNIQTPPILWQTYLILDVVLKKQTFTISDAVASFYKRVRNKNISLRRFPLALHSEEAKAVEEYLLLLEHLYIIKKNDENIYYVHQKLQFPLSQDEQENCDQSLNKRFGKFIMKQASQNQLL